MCVVPDLVLLLSSLALGHRFEPDANKELWVPGWKPLLDHQLVQVGPILWQLMEGYMRKMFPPPNVLLTPSGRMGKLMVDVDWSKKLRTLTLKFAF